MYHFGLLLAGGFFTNCITWETSFKIYFWLCWVLRLQGFPVAGKQEPSSGGCAGLATRRLLLFEHGLRRSEFSVSRDSRAQAQTVGVHGLSCSHSVYDLPGSRDQTHVSGIRRWILYPLNTGSLSPGNLF